MAIVPADDPRRPRRRRAITLDIFTRCGDAWPAISAARREWGIMSVVAVPPVPSVSVESVHLRMTREQMPERFHLPPEPPDQELKAVQATLRETLEEELPDGEESYMREAHTRLHAWQWLMELRDLHGVIVPEGNPSGTDVQGWMSWAPFLSACILFDPPELELLTFADHDDHEAAALPQMTYWRDARAAIEAEGIRAHSVSQSSNLQDQAILYALGTRRVAETYKESTLASLPAGLPGRRSDELADVQCAVWLRAGIPLAAIGERLGLPERSYCDEYNIYRRRPNAAEKAVRRGEAILTKREPRA